MDENKLNPEELKKQFVLNFKKALENMPLDNIVLKKKSQFKVFTKEEVDTYLANPVSNQEQLRQVVEYLITSNPQFNVLCNYLPNIASFNYYMYPVVQNIDNLDVANIKKNYLKAAQKLQIMNIPQEFQRMLTYAFYYDSCFGYEVENKDSYFIKILNPKYCRISAMEDGCYIIQYDFSYFTGQNEKLVLGDENGLVAYPEEFRTKYNSYKTAKNKELMRWQTLDNGIAIKVNETSPDYSTPPFIGLFSDIADIEDFKSLNKAKVESDNYKLIALQIPMNDKDSKEDNFLLSMDVIQMYMQLLQDQIPDGVGFFPTPMKPIEMNFKKDSMSTKNEVADATQNLFDNSGFSKLLFSGAENSTALKYSVEVDGNRLYPIYRQFERIVNRKLKKEFKGKFQVKFLDITRFTKKDTIDQLLKLASASVPAKTMITAAIGMTPLETYGMSILENNVLELHKAWIPLMTSYTNTMDDITNEGGRPPKDDGDLGEAGQQTREIDGNELE